MCFTSFSRDHRLSYITQYNNSSYVSWREPAFKLLHLVAASLSDKLSYDIHYIYFFYFYYAFVIVFAIQWNQQSLRTFVYLPIFYTETLFLFTYFSLFTFNTPIIRILTSSLRLIFSALQNNIQTFRFTCVWCRVHFIFVLFCLDQVLT